jgi:hypothetical protein
MLIPKNFGLSKITNFYSEISSQQVTYTLITPAQAARILSEWYLSSYTEFCDPAAELWDLTHTMHAIP